MKHTMKRTFVAFMMLCLLGCTPAAFGARRALLVGIADYKVLPPSPSRDRSIVDLKGPLNDVAAIKDALVSFYGFSEDEIRVLTDEQATRRQIEATFHEWLIKGTSEGDLVVFYFAGHGSRVEDANNEEADGYDEVLLPYDMVPDGGYHILTDDDLRRWLRKLRGRTVVVIVDSCYSGGTMRGRRVRGEPVSAFELTPAWHGRFLPITNYTPSAEAAAISRGADVPPSVIFLAASGENQLALEVRRPDGRFHGGFSLGLYDGMQRLSTPSYATLFDYVRNVMRDELGLSQEPQIATQGSLISEPAFGGQRVVRAPETLQPIASFEGISENVLVALEPLEGSRPEEMNRLREHLTRLPFVELVDAEEFFDRLIRGVKSQGAYHVRLLNRIGDVERIPPAATSEGVAQQLRKPLEYAYMVKHLAKIHHPNPPFRIRTWVTDQTRRDFKVGEQIVFGVEAERDCYLLLFNLDSQGNIHLLFPNKPHQENFLQGNTTLFIPDEAMGANFSLEFGHPVGEEKVKVIATTVSLDLRELGLGDFSKTFQTISGNTRFMLVKQILEQLSSRNVAWSEDTVTIRSHE
jgi:hypothetical protein